jgi:hypothetical protein
MNQQSALRRRLLSRYAKRLDQSSCIRVALMDFGMAKNL